MKRWKKRLFWIYGTAVGFVVLYFLTAPFVLDYLWKPNVESSSWKLYAPARAAVTRDWFGRRAYDFYCYDICHMGLMMPMEVSHDGR